MSFVQSRPAGSRDVSIDLFRWICILSVVVHHSVFPTRQSPETIRVIFALKEALGWCVTGFFFVSGWLSKPETFGSRFVLDRARRLLVPFVCVNAVVCVAMLALIRLGIFAPKPSEDWSFHGIVLRMIYLQGLGPQFYFLPYLFVTGTVAVAAARILGRTTAAFLWFGLAAIVYSRIGIPSTPFGGEVNRVPIYFVLLGMGMSLRDGHRNAAGVALAVGGLATGIWLASRGCGTTILHSFLPVPLFFSLRAVVRGMRMSFLLYWNSGALFLWHAPIVLPAASILWHVSRFPEGIQLALAIATTIVACQGIHVLVSKMGAAKYLSL